MRKSSFRQSSARLQVEALENRDCPSLVPITPSPPVNLPTGPGQTQASISLPTLNFTPPALRDIKSPPSLPGQPVVPFPTSINFSSLESEIVSAAGAFATAHKGAGLTGNLTTTTNGAVTEVHYSEANGKDSLSFDVVVGPKSASITFAEHVGTEVIRFHISERDHSAVFDILDLVGGHLKFYTRETALTTKP